MMTLDPKTGMRRGDGPPFNDHHVHVDHFADAPVPMLHGYCVHIPVVQQDHLHHHVHVDHQEEFQPMLLEEVKYPDTCPATGYMLEAAIEARPMRRRTPLSRVSLKGLSLDKDLMAFLEEEVEEESEEFDEQLADENEAAQEEVREGTWNLTSW